MMRRLFVLLVVLVAMLAPACSAEDSVVENSIENSVDSAAGDAVNSAAANTEEAPVEAAVESSEGNSVETSVEAGSFEENDYIIYVPAGLEQGHKYPLITAFSPSADARGLIKTWGAHADRHKCIIMASKIIRNGMDIPNYLIRLRSIIHESIAEQYPIMSDRIIALGTSGGGMAAHLFSFFHPDTVAAVISSVGYIHENSLKHKDTYPRDKVCAFLTSPTDFNYKLMKEDRKFLTKLDWRIKWYEFEGGHRTAPEDIREEALTWVLEQLSEN